MKSIFVRMSAFFISWKYILRVSKIQIDPQNVVHIRAKRAVLFESKKEIDIILNFIKVFKIS